MVESERVRRLRRLNDLLRTEGRGGRLVMTRGVLSLGDEQVAHVLSEIRRFNDFSDSNDPFGEHDFGVVKLTDSRVIWKIDYYDLALVCGSLDPSDPGMTTRVMTVMLAEEY